MSSWSPSEFAALFQAWREAIDTPLNERNKISHEVFRRFTVLVGGSTERSEGSVSFKQGSLKNMATLVMAFSDRDKWFAFSLEQKKKWFKMVNRKSYKFIDLDRPMFRTIEKLIQYQAASTNMRVTTASGSGVTGYAESSFARVTLRRNPISRRWATHGVPPVMPALYSPQLAPLLSVAPAHQRLQTPAFLPLAAPRAHAQAPAFLPPPGPRAPVAVPRAQTQAPRREFPFLSAPSRGTSDSRSIFAPSSAPPPRPAPHVVLQSQAIRSSNQNDVIMFDDGEYDSGSSTESDSDVELWEESQSVAARLKALESNSVPIPVRPELPRHHVTSAVASPVQHTRVRSPSSGSPVMIQKEKRGQPPPLSPLFASSGFKKQKIDPELMMVVNILEKQAQELKTLLAEVKDERAGDELQREKELVEKSARDTELQQIIETIKAEAELREKEHEQRVAYQQERSQLMEEVKRLQEERKEFEQERKHEEEARTAMLEQITQDQEERRKDLKQRECERKEREALVQQIKQDREDRTRARSERKTLMRQIVAMSQRERPAKDVSEHEKLPERLKNRDFEPKKREFEPKKRESIDSATNSSNIHKRSEQENKRPSSASTEKETSSKTFSSKMADKKKKWKQSREDQSHARPQRTSGNGERPFDDKSGLSVKKLR